MRRLTISQARRTAIAAQGLDRPRPNSVDLRHLRKAMAQIGALQIDSVNVTTRAHRMTLFARLGAYPDDLVRRAYARRELFEYWAHVAAIVPVQTYPLWRWRMDAWEPWGGVRRIIEGQPGYVEAVLEEVGAHGPMSAGDLEHAGPPRAGSWWDWKPGKHVMEWLFARGDLAIAHRGGGFTRYYDLAERVVPAEYFDAPAISRREAIRQLLEMAAVSAGVGTAADLADWYRLPGPEARAAVAEMAEEGSLVAVEVDGWDKPAYMAPGTVVPRSVDARALVCPFDPIVWNRDRLERLFDFHYRIEIYT
ncbi:winged helix-turn-helix domain-containing protein, partial [bacterium]|nr:winged helix-turn-helix domain-containing protein [bacterium]